MCLYPKEMQVHSQGYGLWGYNTSPFLQTYKVAKQRISFVLPEVDKTLRLDLHGQQMILAPEVLQQPNCGFLVEKKPEF